VRDPAMVPPTPTFNSMNGYDPTKPPVLQSGQWWTLPGGGGGMPVYNITDPLVKAFYTHDDPQSYWQQVGKVVGGNDLQFQAFWNQMYPSLHAQYLHDAEGNKGLLFPDWLTGDKAKGIVQQYQIQPQALRGIDSRLSDKGRFDTSY
jgi:hypothetical protein